MLGGTNASFSVGLILPLYWGNMLLITLLMHYKVELQGFPTLGDYPWSYMTSEDLLPLSFRVPLSRASGSIFTHMYLSVLRWRTEGDICRSLQVSPSSALSSLLLFPANFIHLGLPRLSAPKFGKSIRLLDSSSLYPSLKTLCDKLRQLQGSSHLLLPSQR